ncbi:MAG: acyl-CoA thioesterase [Ardenticatenaceae bacterium]|nr:acyl-CoA thioesterase [Ardenticatenaceae bacterium]
MTEPDDYPFYYPLTVRFSETDLQGHVFFGNYLNYFDTALVNYQKAIGVTYQDLLADGADMVYVEACANFKAPAYFDEDLRIGVRVARIGNSSVRFEFGAIGPQGDLRTSGHIAAVCVHPATRRSVRVPDAFREGVARLQERM